MCIGDNHGTVLGLRFEYIFLSEVHSGRCLMFSESVETGRLEYSYRHFRC